MSLCKRSVFVLTVLGSLLFAACNIDGGGGELLPPSETECLAGNQLFEASPIPLGGLRSIMPLGETGPPDHALPVSHSYFQLEPLDESDYSLGSHAANISAPARVELVAIEYSKGNADFYLHVKVCKDVRMTFGHVQSISPGVEAVADSADFSTWVDMGDTYVKALDAVFETGEVLGVAAGPGVTTLDVSVVDMRREPRAYIRAYDRYSTEAVLEGFPFLPPGMTIELAHDIIPKRLYRFCSVDYFQEPLRSQLKAKIAGSMGTVPALGDPKCQTHMRDVEGTLAGNWFKEPDTHSMLINEDETVALVPHFTDPSRHVFSVPVKYFADLPYDAAWRFPVESTGLNNRYFHEVGDTALYCYDGLNNSINDHAPLPGAFMVQLNADASRLTIEYFSAANCAGSRPSGFSPSAATYYR